MTFTEITAMTKAEKCVGARYQQSGRHAFRDRLTVYFDGKILFERFCYGEAAGLVFSLWAPATAENGEILWDWSSCQNSHKEEAPRRLTGGDGSALLLDEKQAPWERTELLQSDVPHGYSAVGGVLRRLFGR